MASPCRSSLLLILVLECLWPISHAFQSLPRVLYSQSSMVNGAAAKTINFRQPLFTLPKLIVFDLDNTLWSPELYQLRKHQRKNQTPIAHKDVKLLKGAQAALEWIQSMPDTKFALASRTKSVDWAHSLLDQFDIRHLFHHIEIFPGNNKRAHFENIQRASGIQFQDMLFFDDARDGKYGNCEPVSRMGVLTVHCPNGLHSPEIFKTALERFKEWDGSPSTIVEWNGEMTTSGVGISNSNKNMGGRHEGVVKMVNDDKGYGFIRYGDHNTKDVFFHFSALPDGERVEEGNKLTFVISRDAKSGKNRADLIKIMQSSSKSCKDTVKMHAFSMIMPFAALLANGYKTLETRNGTMFKQYPEGTQMLLHVGRRDYPDGNKHIDVMKSGGLNDDEIQDLKSLPQGFGKGMAVAIVEIGKTYETTVEERSDPDFQRKVAAFGEDSGRMVTEIKRVDYLKRPVKVSGQGGVFKVDVDREILPDGWIVSASNVPYISTSKEEKSTSTGSSGNRDTWPQNGKTKPVYSISG